MYVCVYICLKVPSNTLPSQPYPTPLSTCISMPHQYHIPNTLSSTSTLYLHLHSLSHTPSTHPPLTPSPFHPVLLLHTYHSDYPTYNLPNHCLYPLAITSHSSPPPTCHLQVPTLTTFHSTPPTPSLPSTEHPQPKLQPCFPIPILKLHVNLPNLSISHASPPIPMSDPYFLTSTLCPSLPRHPIPHSLSIFFIPIPQNVSTPSPSLPCPYSPKRNSGKV